MPPPSKSESHFSADDQYFVWIFIFIVFKMFCLCFYNQCIKAINYSKRILSAAYSFFKKFNWFIKQNNWHKSDMININDQPNQEENDQNTNYAKNYKCSYPLGLLSNNNIVYLSTIKDYMELEFLNLPKTKLMANQIQFFKYIYSMEQKCIAKGCHIRMDNRDFILPNAKGHLAKVAKYITRYTLRYLQNRVRKILHNKKILETEKHMKVQLPTNVFIEGDKFKNERIEFIKNAKKRFGPGIIFVECYANNTFPKEFGEQKANTTREEIRDPILGFGYKWTVRLNITPRLKTTNIIARILHECTHIMAFLYNVNLVDAIPCEERKGLKENEELNFRTTMEHDANCDYCKNKAMWHHGSNWQDIRNVITDDIGCFLPNANFDDIYLDDLEYPHIIFGKKNEIDHVSLKNANEEIKKASQMTPNFLRSLSQRLKSKNRQSHRQPQPSELKPPQQQPPAEIINLRDTQCQCRIQLLDGTDLNLAIEKTALGQDLYSRVFAYLDLDERDYFGLQFTDHFQVQHWLDPAKRVRKQIPIGPPYTLRFRVKFFPNEPANLRDELTRYLFFLQLRQDIHIGRLECSKAIAIELGALRLQSEFGDFNPREHSQTFVSEFRYHPMQDRQMELAILRHWSSGQMQGFSPSQAEMAFLEKARQLPLYGVDLHFVLGRDGQEYRLGLSPQGMLVLDGAQKIGLFLWEKIQRLDFRGRRLSLVVEEDLPTQHQQQKGGQLVQLHTFLFHLSSSRAAKHLWKCAIEFHTFFRLKYLRPTQQQRRVLPSLLRLGSTFRYRGRTEYETIQRKGNTPTIGHPQQQQRQRAESAERPAAGGHVFRRPSRRYAPREPLPPPNPTDSGGNGPSPGPTLIPVRTSASTPNIGIGREQHRKMDERNENGREGWSARSKIAIGSGGGKPMSTEF